MKLTLTGSALYSGELELDPYSLTIGERRRMKHLTGLAGMDVFEALIKDDLDVYFALYVIALEREGTRVDVPMLESEQGVLITADFTPAEASDEGPLGPRPSGAESSETESGKSG